MVKAIFARFAEQRLPSRLIIVIGGLAVVALMFIRLWSEIAEGDLASFDTAILLSFRQTGSLAEMIGPPWFQQTMIDITTLGGRTVLTLIIAGSACFMLMKHAYRLAALIVGATLSGSLIVAALKGFLARPRPLVVEQLVTETSMSFPSGHAANSAIVYLTIAIFFMRYEPKPATRYFVLGLAVLIVTAIGISRIAMGVHWPSDVLAGWLFGTTWACLWALIVKLPAAKITEEVPQDDPVVFSESDHTRRPRNEA